MGQEERRSRLAPRPHPRSRAGPVHQRPAGTRSPTSTSRTSTSRTGPSRVCSSRTGGSRVAGQANAEPTQARLTGRNHCSRSSRSCVVAGEGAVTACKHAADGWRRGPIQRALWLGEWHRAPRASRAATDRLRQARKSRRAAEPAGGCVGFPAGSRVPTHNDVGVVGLGERLAAKLSPRRRSPRAWVVTLRRRPDRGARTSAVGDRWWLHLKALIRPAALCQTGEAARIASAPRVPPAGCLPISTRCLLCPAGTFVAA